MTITIIIIDDHGDDDDISAPDALLAYCYTVVMNLVPGKVF